MVNIDMWYGDDYRRADEIDIAFYPNGCEYRGNIYIKGKMVGDYSCRSSVELEEKFSQLSFDWGE